MMVILLKQKCRQLIYLFICLVICKTSILVVSFMLEKPVPLFEIKSVL